MRKIKKIVVTGGTGRFGSVLEKNKFNFKMLFPKKNKLDIRKFVSIKNYLRKTRPFCLIHLAGLSRPMKIHEKEISKSIDDPSKVEDLINMLDDRKKEPIDYRRTGVVTLFTGVGLFLFGVFFLGSVLKGVGALVAAIGLGQIIAGYLYPNTSEELTNAVEDFEKK